MNLFKSTKATTYISSRGDKVYPIIMDIKTGIVEGDAVFTTGDIDTAYLYATILEEQSDYNILGSTVICNIQRPDGTTMKVQGDVLGNNLIEFPLGQSGVSQEGIYNFDIAVVFSEKKMVTSPTAQYSVTQSIEVVGEIEEDDRFPVLESLISGINVINEEELVRISNEEVRQSKEEAREQAESVRVRNEEVRLANNEAIRNEEAVRVVNENERKNAESLRVQEENKRKQQENTRITQENTRVSQETARVNAENTRKNQEATRQANEATRVSQETNRNQAESTRNSNETVRQNQENTRKNQEQTRVTAEGNRVTSENVRVSAEQARVLKEQERQAIEVERQNSESTREQQEATRVSQENARKQADILRQQEHESRQQFLDGFEGKLNTVVDDVATIKDDVVSVREANKRQDVFLQGLYNENLDGRVTVKEEGSVISLTNSDDGLVDIVGLEGNTLVNYVQDGAKELTLNGDIDVEGTNVALTEGVDNGLVDVVCEGNTLVNLLPNKELKITCNNDWDNFCAIGRPNVTSNITFGNTIQDVKPNTTYTLIYNVVTRPTSNHYLINNVSTGTVFDTYVRVYSDTPLGINKVVLTTLPDLTDKTVVLRQQNGTGRGEVYIKDYMLLEGDWTNKEIPQYFEGMKSVAECEDNKIEILSQNYQELNTDTNGLVCHLKAGTSAITNNIMSDLSGNGNNATLYGASINGNYLNFNGENDYATIDRCVSDDFTISLKAEVISAKGGSLGNDGLWYNYAGLVDGEYPSIVNDFGLTITNEGYPCLGIGKPDMTVRHKETCFNKLTTFTYTRNKTTGEMKLYIDGKHSATISSTNKDSLNDNPLLIIGKSAAKTTAYAKMKFYELKIYNKVLNESEIFKFNKKEISLNEPLRALPNGVCDKVMKVGGKWYVERNCGEIVLDGSEDWQDRWNSGYGIEKHHIFHIKIQGMKKEHGISDMFAYGSLSSLSGECVLFREGGEGEFGVNIKTSRLPSEDVDGFKQWLQNNPVTVVYQLAIPIYEELPTDPTLNTYNDITHISNNSTIPCNMTVKNTGYTSIIKPSTKYTVAFDTDRGGEVGINLGGSKVTTTNNVATVTTPSTLTDDSLRLYSKGIKASKVRLLEGDKTNWIPSFFEGMKSSFEEQVEEDKYKIEILSRNKNLFDGAFDKTITSTHLWSKNYILVEPNTQYIGSHRGTNADKKLDRVEYYDKNKNLLSFQGIGDTINTPSNCKYIKFRYHIPTQDINEVAKVQIEKGNDVTQYVEPKCNKIQFSSIEPLRGVGNVKDRFVFKDGKLMIERNFNKLILDGSIRYPDWHQTNMYISIYPNANDKTTCYRVCNIPNKALKWQSSTSNMFATCVTNEAFEKNAREGYLSDHTTLPNIYLCIGNTNTLTLDDFYEYIKENPIEIVYRLAEPTYEEVPFELQKIILEGYKNGTLFFDTNIPPTVEASYTANIPVVSELNKNSNEIGLTQEDLSVTQVAVDFLLMSNIGEEMLSSFNLNTRGRNSMGVYFANRIMKGALKYEDVISKYPQYKEEIDSILETK